MYGHKRVCVCVLMMLIILCPVSLSHVGFLSPPPHTCSCSPKPFIIVIEDFTLNFQHHGPYFCMVGTRLSACWQDLSVCGDVEHLNTGWSRLEHYGTSFSPQTHRHIKNTGSVFFFLHVALNCVSTFEDIKESFVEYCNKPLY